MNNASNCCIIKMIIKNKMREINRLGGEGELEVVVVVTIYE